MSKTLPSLLEDLYAQMRDGKITKQDAIKAIMDEFKITEIGAKQLIDHGPLIPSWKVNKNCQI